jgi:hypothetical protein
MTNIIQVPSNFRRARVSCIKTRPDAIASVSVRRVPGPQLRVSFVRRHDIARTLPTRMRIEGRAVGDLASGTEASFVGILSTVGRSGHVHEQACVPHLRLIQVLRTRTSPTPPERAQTAFFSSLALHWRSPESGDVWHKSRQLK